MTIRLLIDGVPWFAEEVEEVEFLDCNSFEIKHEDGRVKLRPQEGKDVSVQ